MFIVVVCWWKKLKIDKFDARLKVMVMSFDEFDGAHYRHLAAICLKRH